MSIHVEHEKRKKAILKKALDVFYTEGYADTTFQKIADRCGISRTILYLYFKNKQVIFRQTIQHLADEIEAAFIAVLSDPGVPVARKIENLMDIVLDRFVSEKKLFHVLLEYLTREAKRDGDPAKKVRRQTVTIRRLLERLVTSGIKSGEFRMCNAHAVNEAIYGLLQAAALRLAILGEVNVAGIKAAVKVIIDGLKTGR